MRNNFARDPNQAEAAGVATLQGLQRSGVGPGASKPTPEAPTKEPNTKFKTSFREDAKIWELYLDDAERVARERVGQWNTGLDSILIFAGLFAGVVASFVVEVTVDSNGNNLSPSLSMQSPSTRSLWTTGLWCCSLIITIFGAIMGVLAKTWISNFIPVSSKKGAEDAYKRLMLDKQADHLRLGSVILFIPLLVQIASYLFATGFVVILFNTNAAIGTVVAVLVGTGAAAYLITTFIAAWSHETFPFRTPLSDLLKNLKYLRNLRNLRNIKNLFRSNKEKQKYIMSKGAYDVELAEIWLEKLIKSTNPSTVNEAIAELARQWDEKGFDQWRDKFCSPDVLKILLERIKDYVKPKPDQARDELYLHMECLMHLVRYIESPAKPPPNVNAPILHVLRMYLESDGPLYRWNVFHEDVRPLAFCVTTHIMILLARIHVLHPQQNSSFKYGDLTITEGEEQPWENMFYKVPGSHRFKFLLASSRGLVEGQRNIKTISLHTLSLYLAKASAIGQGSERSAEVNTVMLRHAEDIGKEYIACLMRGIAEEWDTEMDERSPNETLTINTYSRSNVDFTEDTGKDKNPVEDKSLLEHLLSLLLHPESVFRTHGLKIISEALVHLNSDSLNNILEDTLMLRIAELFISDKDVKVKELSLKIVQGLLGQNDDNLNTIMKVQIEKAVQQGLESSNESSRLHALKPFEDFIADEPLFLSYKKAAGALVKIFFTDVKKELYSKAWIILTHLHWNFSKDEEFQNTIRQSIFKSIGTAFSDRPEWESQIRILSSALDFLMKFDFLTVDIDSWIKVTIIDRAFESTFSKENMSECAEVWLRHLVIDGNKEPGLGNKNLSQQLYDNKVDRLRSILAVNGDSNLWSIKVRSCLQERLHQDLNDTENRISQYVATKLCGLGEASLVPTLTLLATGEKIMKGDILPSLKDIITNYDDFTLEPGTLQIILNELDNILSSTELWYTIPEFKDPWIEITCLISKTIDFPNGIRKVVDIIINTPEDWSRSCYQKFLTSNLVYAKYVITPPEDLDLSLQCLDKCEIGIRWLELLTLLRHKSLESQGAAIKILTSVLNTIKGEDKLEDTSSPNQGSLQRVIEEQKIIAFLEAESPNEAKDASYIIRLQVLEYLTQYFPEEMRNSVTVIIDIASNNNSDDQICAIAMKSLVHLNETDQFKPQIKEWLFENEKSLSQHIPDIWIKKLEALVLEGDITLPLEKIMGVPVDFNHYNRNVRSNAVLSLNTLANADNDALTHTLLTKTYPMTISDPDREVRQAWVSFFTLLATKEHQNAVKAIVKIAQDDEDIDLRIQAIESLTSLVKSSEKVREIVIKDTSTYLDSVGWASDQSDRIKVAWTNLKLQTILLSKSERNFIPNFVEAITQDLSLSIKEIITVTLVNLYVGDIDANQATIMDSLTGRIELGLRNQDVDIRNRSILAIGLISQAIAVREIQKDDFREREATANFVKGISGKLLPPLLRIITNEEGDIFTAAENAFEGIKAASENRHLYYYDGATVSRSSLSAIPQVLELITDKGKDFVIRFVQTLQTDIYRFRTVNDVTVSVVRKIVNALSRTRRPSHAAALELLIHFHQNDSCVRVIHSAIPEIISIALSRDTAEKVRILALDLIYLASSDDDDNNNLNEIIQRQHEFMLLLENAKHSHRAAKVLSIMAKNKDVRKDILSQIISHCIREDIKTHKGYITLIFQLLIDGRFKEEPTDYIMIILASTLVKRPKLAHLRFPVVSALWCYYYKILKEKTKADLPSDLAKWFTVALFGRHITSYEVRTWNTMGAGWLQNAQTNENTGEEHQVSNERPEIRISEP